MIPLQDLATPALVLDLDALEANIAAAIAHAANADIALRPHAKSHKSVDIARRLTTAGALGACVATVAEAEALVKGGMSGLLLTAPIATLEQCRRVAALVAGGADLMVVCDHPDAVAAMSRASVAVGTSTSCLVDCDVGQGRTGVSSVPAALELAGAIDSASGLSFVGVQGYWGHLQQVPTVRQRSEKVSEQAARLKAIVAALTEAGHAPPIVTGGGTGTLDIDPTLDLFTELQPGSFLFLDSLYGPLPILQDGTNPFRHALFVRAAVVSANGASGSPVKVVVNAGLKAFATDSGIPMVWAGASRDAIYRYMGDEHGALEIAEDAIPALGDFVEFVPSHCDPTVNLYGSYAVRKGGEIVGIWPISGRYGETQ